MDRARDSHPPSLHAHCKGSSIQSSNSMLINLEDLYSPEVVDFGAVPLNEPRAIKIDFDISRWGQQGTWGIVWIKKCPSMLFTPYEGHYSSGVLPLSFHFQAAKAGPVTAKILILLNNIPRIPVLFFGDISVPSTTSPADNKVFVNQCPSSIKLRPKSTDSTFLLLQHHKIPTSMLKFSIRDEFQAPSSSFSLSEAPAALPGGSTDGFEASAPSNGGSFPSNKVKAREQYERMENEVLRLQERRRREEEERRVVDMQEVTPSIPVSHIIAPSLNSKSNLTVELLQAQLCELGVDELPEGKDQQEVLGHAGKRRLNPTLLAPGVEDKEKRRERDKGGEMAVVAEDGAVKGKRAVCPMEKKKDGKDFQGLEGRDLLGNQETYEEGDRQKRQQNAESPLQPTKESISKLLTSISSIEQLMKNNVPISAKSGREKKLLGSLSKNRRRQVKLGKREVVISRKQWKEEDEVVFDQGRAKRDGKGKRANIIEISAETDEEAAKLHSRRNDKAEEHHRIQEENSLQEVRRQTEETSERISVLVEASTQVKEHPTEENRELYELKERASDRKEERHEIQPNYYAEQIVKSVGARDRRSLIGREKCSWEHSIASSSEDEGPNMWSTTVIKTSEGNVKRKAMKTVVLKSLESFNNVPSPAISNSYFATQPPSTSNAVIVPHAASFVPIVPPATGHQKYQVQPSSLLSVTQPNTSSSFYANPRPAVLSPYPNNQNNLGSPPSLLRSSVPQPSPVSPESSLSSPPPLIVWKKVDRQPKEALVQKSKSGGKHLSITYSSSPSRAPMTYAKAPEGPSSSIFTIASSSTPPELSNIMDSPLLSVPHKESSPKESWDSKSQYRVKTRMFTEVSSTALSGPVTEKGGWGSKIDVTEDQWPSTPKLNKKSGCGTVSTRRNETPISILSAPEMKNENVDARHEEEEELMDHSQRSKKNREEPRKDEEMVRTEKGKEEEKRETAGIQRSMQPVQRIKSISDTVREAERNSIAEGDKRALLASTANIKEMKEGLKKILTEMTLKSKNVKLARYVTGRPEQKKHMTGLHPSSEVSVDRPQNASPFPPSYVTSTPSFEQSPPHNHRLLEVHPLNAAGKIMKVKTDKEETLLCDKNYRDRILPLFPSLFFHGAEKPLGGAEKILSPFTIQGHQRQKREAQGSSHVFPSQTRAPITPRESGGVFSQSITHSQSSALVSESISVPSIPLSPPVSPDMIDIPQIPIDMGLVTTVENLPNSKKMEANVLHKLRINIQIPKSCFTSQTRDPIIATPLFDQDGPATSCYP